MKKTFLITSLFLLVLLGSSAFMIRSGNGIQGYAGSPGEATCSNCHSGGFSASSGITITAVPDFSLNINSELEYIPDSVYQITITTSADGFTKYGFACEILNINSTNAGTLSSQGTGVKFLNAGLKRTATHTTPKNGNPALFTFKWIAPTSGDVRIYAISNAVNGNNNTSGDFVLSPTSLNLVAAPVTIPIDTLIDDVGVKEIEYNPLSRVSVFPNPANELVSMCYYLNSKAEIKIELMQLNGSLIKILYKETEYPGEHSQFLILKNIASGVYFLRASANNIQVAQKLLLVQ